MLDITQIDKNFVVQTELGKEDIRFYGANEAPFSLHGVSYEDGCYLLFGKETKGLPEEFLEAHRESCVRIPMRSEARSLNLSNAVAVTVFEALRQLSFPGLKDYGKMRG